MSDSWEPSVCARMNYLYYIYVYLVNNGRIAICCDYNFTARVQRYHSNGLQEIVASIHFVKLRQFLCKTPWIRTYTSTVMGPGGTTGMHPSQMGPNSFVFAYISAEKCMRRRLAPPTELVPPPPSGKSWIRHCSRSFPGLQSHAMPTELPVIRYEQLFD